MRHPVALPGNGGGLRFLNFLNKAQRSNGWNDLNGAKRWNGWNHWNRLIPVMNGAQRLNVWNNWNFGTLGTCVCLKRFELSEAGERLERLELASA
jgi:hypothetical protein